MKRSTLNLSIRNLVKKQNAKELRYDLEIQRGHVWPDYHRSLLIHSVLYGYPVPAMYVQEDGSKVLQVLDGKQRLETFVRFMNGELTLHKDTPGIPTEDGSVLDIAGATFKDLPEDLQDDFASTTLTVYNMTDMTTDEVEELFWRLQQGMKLTDWESSRAKAGGLVRGFVNEIKDLPFMSKLRLSNRQLNRFADEEVIFHTLAVLDGQRIGHGGHDMYLYSQSLKAAGVPQELHDQTKAVFSYLDSLPLNPAQCRAIFKKVNVPAIAAGISIFADTNVAAAALVEFFSKVPEQYAAASRGATGKWLNVKARMDTLRSFFESKGIASAVPEAEEETGDQTTNTGEVAATLTEPLPEDATSGAESLQGSIDGVAAHAVKLSPREKAKKVAEGVKKDDEGDADNA